MSSLNGAAQLPNKDAWSQPVRIFGQWSERLVLIAPLVGLVGFALQIHFMPSPSISTQHIWAFFSQIIFLNTIHILFTFDLLVAVPAYRDILKKGRPQIQALIIFCVFVAALALRLLESRLKGNWGLMILAVIILYDIYHVMRQTLGLSLLYNFHSSKMLPNSNDIQRLKKLDLQERFTCGFIILLGSSQFLIGHWIEKEHVSWVQIERIVMATFGCVLVFALMVQYYRINRVLFRNKIIYVIRYALVMSTFISFFGLVVLKSVHGIEYFFVYRRIKNNSAPERGKLKFLARAFILLLASIVFIGLLVEPSYGVFALFHLEEMVDRPWFHLLSVVVGALALVHYFLDGQIFAMKNEPVRQSTGRWLLMNPPPSYPLGVSRVVPK